MTKILSKLFSWKVLNEYSFDKRIFSKKSVILVEKNGKMGIVLRLGRPGSLEYHELFGDDLEKFKLAFKEAMDVLDRKEGLSGND